MGAGTAPTILSENAMNRRFARFAILFLPVLCPFVLLATTARAWNSPGHMIVALIAYEQMDDATRTKAIELLRQHPRFPAHFERVMPREVTRESDEVKARWYFAHSATWPDQVRSPSATVDREDVNRFSRPYWHYINQPIFLNDADRAKLEPGLRLYVNRTPPADADDPSMNVIQAFKNSTRIVSDPNSPADSRAVHLCWLTHLAGDSHQPLHSGALYTPNRFPQGDHGGNDLEVEHGWKLHGFWDDQICTQDLFLTLRTLAANSAKNERKAAVGRKAAGTVDIEKWIDESHQHALRSVYTKEVTDLIASREEHTHLGPLNVSAGYRKDAEALAERRAIEAGFRLAALLQQVLK